MTWTFSYVWFGIMFQGNCKTSFTSTSETPLQYARWRCYQGCRKGLWRKESQDGATKCWACTSRKGSWCLKWIWCCTGNFNIRSFRLFYNMNGCRSACGYLYFYRKGLLRMWNKYLVSILVTSLWWRWFWVSAYSVKWLWFVEELICFQWQVPDLAARKSFRISLYLFGRKMKDRAKVACVYCPNRSACMWDCPHAFIIICESSFILCGALMF